MTRSFATLLFIVLTLQIAGSAVARVAASGVAPTGHPIRADSFPLDGMPASPREFGFPVPLPEPVLPADVDGFDPPNIPVGGNGTAIAEIARTAGPGEVVSMTGIGLAGVVFDVFSQGGGAASGEVSHVKPIFADGTAAAVLLPSTVAKWSMYLVWPRRAAEGGKPFSINRTEAWWAGPKAATAGATVSVYGRNLARSNGTLISHIYLKPVGKPGWFLKPGSVNPFRVEFTVPDVVPAMYEVWVHNSHGGRFGWSGPLPLEVLAHAPWAGQSDRVLDVRQAGATGNGVTDDTQAIRDTLDKAAALAPATVYFPAGSYRITAPLQAPMRVAWRGEGVDRTILRLGASVDASMITIVGNATRFEQLTLDANGHTGAHPLLSIGFAGNTKLTHIRLRAWGTAALDAQQAYGLFIDFSELIENGSFYGSSRQVFLSHNRFLMTGNGESVVALWGGRDFAMSDNRLVNADEQRDDGNGIGRFFVGQAHFGNLENLYWENNVSRNAAPFDCARVDCNKGEQICFEMVNSRLKDDFVAASAYSVTFRELAEVAAPLPGGRTLVIVGGRGAGQHRTIGGWSGTTLYFDKPWNVIPDRTSRFALAASASHAAIYNNGFDGRDGYDTHDSDSTGVLLYGSVYDVVVDSNRISRMRHGMMTVALSAAEGLSPYFLQYSRNHVRNSNSGLYVGTTFADAGFAGIWGGLGSVYRGNLFEEIAYIGVEYETWDHRGSDLDGIVFDGNRFSNLPFGFIDAYQLMWTHDGRFRQAPRERSARLNTVLHANHFDRGTANEIGSIGFRTLHPGNTWLDIGSTWKGFQVGQDGPGPCNGAVVMGGCVSKR